RSGAHPRTPRDARRARRRSGARGAAREARRRRATARRRRIRPRRHARYHSPRVPRGVPTHDARRRASRARKRAHRRGDDRQRAAVLASRAVAPYHRAMTAAELASRLAAFLTAETGARRVTIDGLRRLAGGASRETWAFDAVLDDPEPIRRQLVLRRD